MLRFLLVLVLLAVLYVMWDRGAFGSRGDRRETPISADERARPGPAQELGAAVDRGIAQAGRAVERAGRDIENAANGRPAVRPTP